MRSLVSSTVICAGRSAHRRAPLLAIRGASAPQAVRSRNRRRGHPTKEEQLAEWETEAEVRENPPRAVPLTHPGFIQRLREWFATVPLAPDARL